MTGTGSGHEVGLINPSITVARGYNVGFALSDPSLVQTVNGKKRQIFEFNLYEDKNFIKPYYSNPGEPFQVVGVGTVGVFH